MELLLFRADDRAGIPPPPPTPPMSVGGGGTKTITKRGGGCGVCGGVWGPPATPPPPHPPPRGADLLPSTSSTTGWSRGRNPRRPRAPPPPPSRDCRSRSGFKDSGVFFVFSRFGLVLGVCAARAHRSHRRDPRSHSAPASARTSTAFIKPTLFFSLPPPPQTPSNHRMKERKTMKTKKNNHDMCA